MQQHASLPSALNTKLRTVTHSNFVHFPFNCRSIPVQNALLQGWKRAILLDNGHHAVLNQIHITGLTSEPLSQLRQFELLLPAAILLSKACTVQTL